MKNAQRTQTYYFNGEGPHTIAIDGRRVTYDGRAEMFRTSAAALSRYESDLRMMMKHPSYVVSAP